MSAMTTAEIMLRTAAVLACALLMGSLLVRRRPGQSEWLAAIFSFGVMAFVLTSFRGANEVLGVWHYPLTFLCVTKAAWFWLLSRSLFVEGFRLRLRHGLLVAVAGAAGMWQQLIHVPQARSMATSGFSEASSLGVDAGILVLILLALAEAWRGLSTDLLDGRRRLRVVFVAAVSAYLAVAVGVQLYNMLLDAGTPRIVMLVNMSLIFASAAAISLSLLQAVPSSWLVSPRREPELASAPRDEMLVNALLEAFDTRRIYRDETMTIGKLAQLLGAQERQLRRLINRTLGYRNFADLLHAYRIREVCARLCRPEEAQVPVLSMALDAGFGSIGPFNRAFKARIGMTPTRFRELSLRSS